MFETEVQLKKWGQSIGVIIPKKDIEREKMKEGDKVKLMVMKKSNVLAETFGTLKAKRPTAALMRDIDRELYHDE